MVMKVLRDGAFGGFLKYVLMSLLALSVLGLVFMDVRGVLQGNVGGTDVASVGSQTIGLREFDKYIRLILARRNMTPQEAYAKTTLINELLRTQVRSRFVEEESEALGLSVSKKKIQQELIARIKASQQDGEELQQTLERILREQGISEEDFLRDYSREIIGDVMIEFLQAGVSSSPSISEDLFRFQNHTRDVDLIIFDNKEIQNITLPDNAKIQKLYDSFKQTEFKIPELRSFEMVFIDKEKVKATIEIAHSDIEDFYKSNIENYLVPVQRVMSQAVVKEKADAEKILHLISDKKLSLEDAKKKVMGDSGMYIPSSPFREDMLIADMQGPIMGAKDGDVVGPLQTLMGFHVIHVTETIKEHTPKLEEVENSIKEELISEEATDKIYSLSDTMSDLVAGGSSFQEIGESIPITTLSIPAVSRTGLDADSNDVFSKMTEQDNADKEIILEEGFALQSGETSRVVEFPSGRVGVISLAQIQTESFKPFEQVKDKIIEDYVKDMQLAENNKRVDVIFTSLNEGSKNFEDVAKEYGKKIQSHSDLSLSVPLPAPLSENNRPGIFETAPGKYVVLRTNNGSVIAKVNAYHLPEIKESGREQIDAIKDAVSTELKDEVFFYYVNALSDKYPVYINEQLLKLAYRPSPSDSNQQK